jgi:hypothetical protein
VVTAFARYIDSRLLYERVREGREVAIAALKADMERVEPIRVVF